MPLIDTYGRDSALDGRNASVSQYARSSRRKAASTLALGSRGIVKVFCSYHRHLFLKLCPSVRAFKDQHKSTTASTWFPVQLHCSVGHR